MFLWNSPALGMIWSLIPYVEQTPNKFAPKSFFPIYYENIFKKKTAPYFMGGDIMPLLHWKVMWGYVIPLYLQEGAD